MAAITPPTLSQIKMMRESIKGCHDYRVKIDWDAAVLDSTQAFLIWDDDNQLLYAIQENVTRSMYEAPFRISVVAYDQIEDITTNHQS